MRDVQGDVDTTASVLYKPGMLLSFLLVSGAVLKDVVPKPPFLVLEELEDKVQSV